MKNIINKFFSLNKKTNHKELSFLEIEKTTKVSEIFKAISNYNNLSEI